MPKSNQKCGHPHGCSHNGRCCSCEIVGLRDTLSGLLDEYECQEAHFGHTIAWLRHEDPGVINRARVALGKEIPHVQ